MQEQNLVSEWCLKWSSDQYYSKILQDVANLGEKKNHFISGSLPQATSVCHQRRVVNYRGSVCQDLLLITHCWCEPFLMSSRMQC